MKSKLTEMFGKWKPVEGVELQDQPFWTDIVGEYESARTSAHNSDYTKCKDELKAVARLCNPNNPEHEEIFKIVMRHFA